MLVLWYLLISVIGVIAFPFAYVMCPGFKDRGWGISKALGLILVVYPSWISAQMHFIPFSRTSTVLSILVVLILSALIAWKRKGEMLDFLRANWKTLLATELVFLCAFIFMAMVRMKNPEIASRWQGYGSEKLMDMNFVNSILRSRWFPPMDNWFSGHEINYYYHGYYLTAFLTLLTNHPSEYTYNLMVVLLFALAFVGCYCVGRNLTGKPLCGILCALVVLVLGNMQGAVLVWKDLPSDAKWTSRMASVWQYGQRDFLPQDVWACSRVIDLPNDRTINEFPYFSFLWGDLHGHLVSLPFCVLLLALLANTQWLRTGKSSLPGERSNWWAALVIALVLGAIAAINSWDLPSYFLLTLGAGLVFVGRAKLPDWLRECGLRILAVVGGIIFYLPFYLHFVAPSKGMNRVAQKSTLDKILIIFGLHLFLVLTYLILRFIQHTKVKDIKRMRTLGVVFGVTTVLMLIAVAVGHQRTAQWVVGPLAAVLIFVVMLYALSFLQQDAWKERFALLLVALSVCIVIGCEFVAMKDFYGEASARMNTVFKFHFQTWLFLAVAGSMGLGMMLDKLKGNWAWKAAGILWLIALLLLIQACSVFTWKGTRAKTNNWKTTPTLDGLQYMKHNNSGDYEAIIWLREETKGLRGSEAPLLLEATKDPYSDFSRFATFTGLPSLIGWANHEGIWHRNSKGVNPHNRPSIVKNIYGNINFGESRKLLDEHKIKYVIVGSLEHQEYDSTELGKFAKHMTTVFEKDSTAVYSGYLEPERVDYPDEEQPIDKRKAAKRLDLIRVIGSKGEFPGQFEEVRGVAAAPDGSVYTVDKASHRVQKFAAEGDFVMTWGSHGGEPGQFNAPHGIEVDADGNVYVADTWNHRIQKFDAQGHFLTSWTGEFWGPRDLAIAEDGTVFVADTGNKLIKVFTKDGAPIRRWGGDGKDSGRMVEPVGVGVYAERVYVCDVGNRRIQVFTFEGEFVKLWNVVSGWREFFTEPYLAIDSKGRLVVSDSKLNRLQCYSLDGEFIDFYGMRGTGDSEFDQPMGLAFTPDGHLLVGDVNNGRIQKLALPTASQ